MRNITIMLLTTVLLLMLSVGIGVSYYQQSPSRDELVIVVHGLARSDNAMWLIETRLANAGYDVCLLDYKTIGQDSQLLFADTEQQIARCLNGQKTHFVGHSLGGLVIKNFLNKSSSHNNIADLGEVVFVGTPNHGSEVADALRDHYIMTLGGDVTQSLMQGSDTLGRQVGKNTIPVGVIAGTKSNPLTEKYFTAANDGFVSVESTKLANMKDFITLPVGHSAMRYDGEVATQIMHFLENGQFHHRN